MIIDGSIESYIVFKIIKKQVNYISVLFIPTKRQKINNRFAGGCKTVIYHRNKKINEKKNYEKKY